MRSPMPQRFWEKVSIRGDDECWLWMASRSHDYGSFYLNGRKRKATQVAWELFNKREWPQGKHACHSCDNKPCVNPRHIWPGTHQENLQDAGAKGLLSGPRKPRETCKWGHPLNSENTYIGPKGRDCLICRKLRNLERIGQRGDRSYTRRILAKLKAPSDAGEGKK